MRVVYLAHPVSAPTREGIEANRARAIRWALWIARTFDVAVSADWIWMTGALEETPENRAFGLARDLVMVGRADEFWLVGGRVSSGMRAESGSAELQGVRIRDLTSLGEEPPAPGEQALAVDLLLDALQGPVRAREVRGNNISREDESDCG